MCYWVSIYQDQRGWWVGPRGGNNASWGRGAVGGTWAFFWQKPQENRAKQFPKGRRQKTARKKKKRFPTDIGRFGKQAWGQKYLGFERSIGNLTCRAPISVRGVDEVGGVSNFFNQWGGGGLKRRGDTHVLTYWTFYGVQTSHTSIKGREVNGQTVLGEKGRDIGNIVPRPAWSNSNKHSRLKRSKRGQKASGMGVFGSGNVPVL